MDVVDTAEEAAGLELPPLVVREPLEAFLDEHGIGSGRLEVERIGEGHSNITFLVRRGDARVVLRRPPRPPLPPSAHDVLREARLLRALEGTPVRVPPVLAVGDDESVLGVPFYVMEEVHGNVLASTIPDALDTPAERRRTRGGARGRARGGARGRLASLRARGLREADRLPGAPAAALRRAVGAQQDARARGGRGARRVARGEHARVARVDDRARRLPARQRDDGRRRTRRAGRDLRLGAVHDRRPAGRRRLPDRHLDRARRPGRHDVLEHRRRDPARGLPLARRADRALRGAERPLDVGAQLVPGARALEGRRVHGGQLQALPVRAAPTTSTSRSSTAACRCSPRRRARSRTREGPPGRLRRRADDERVRVLPRLLRRRGARPGHGQAAVPRGPARARARARPRARRADRGGVRRGLRRAARAGARSPRRARGPDVRPHPAGRRDGRGAEASAVAGREDRADLELDGRRAATTARPSRSCSTAW